MKESSKKENKLKISMQELQQNNEELNRCKESPVYFYNKYIRKEGQKVLTEEEYKEMIIAVQALRAKVSASSIGSKKAKYPLTPAEAILSKVAEEKIKEVIKEETHLIHRLGVGGTSFTVEVNEDWGWAAK